jgi:hypothetical protein
MCRRSHEHFVLARTVMLLCIRDKVITDLAKAPRTPPVTLMKRKYEEMRITCQAGSHNLHSDMNDREPGAFHTDCMMYETGLLPWDIEMTVEDPESDDDDGTPHRVSDSESESQSEQDSDYFFV